MDIEASTNATIAVLSRECLELWDRLTANTAASIERRAVYTAQRAQFYVWCASMSVFHEKVSIEYVLRDNETARRAILQVVRALLANLRSCDRFEWNGAAGVEPPQNSKPLHDGNLEVESEEEASEIDESPEATIKRIEDSIKRLTRFSNSIRRHGASKGDLKASKYEPRDLEEFKAYAKFALKLEIGLDPNSFEDTPLTPLQNKLLSSIVDRWRRLSYRAAQVSLGHTARATRPAPEIRTPILPEPTLIATSTSIEKTPSRSAHVEQTDHHQIAQSDIRPSTVGPSLVLKQEPLPKVSANSRVGTLFDASNLDFPKPSLRVLATFEETERRSFVCPYCRIIQSFDPSSKQLWESHVMRDLSPYICLQNGCTNQASAFTDSQTWIKHMRYDHGPQIWECSTCKEATKNEAKKVQDRYEYKIETQFITHMKNSHITTLTDGEIEVVAKLAVRRRPLVLEQCIICGVSQDDSKLLDGQVSLSSEDMQKILFEHMRDHLRACALLSLPWDDVEDDVPGDRSLATQGSPDASAAAHGDESTGTDRSDDDLPSADYDNENMPTDVPRIDPVYLAEIKKAAGGGSQQPVSIGFWLRNLEDSTGQDPDSRGSQIRSEHLQWLYRLVDERSHVSHDITRKSNDSGSTQERFIPNGLIERSFQDEANNFWRVRGLLSEVVSYRVSPKDLAEKCSRVFCILILIEKAEFIATFLDYEKLWDAQLPFGKNAPDAFPRDSSDPGFYEKFIDAQWQFCAATLQSHSRLRIPESQILPIITGSRVGDGPKARVHQVKIHEYHDAFVRPHLLYHAYHTELSISNCFQDPPQDSNHVYAIKTFKGRDADFHYDRELEAFKRITQADGQIAPGLIKVYGSFEYRETFNVILEYADVGTLEQVFREGSIPATRQEMLGFWTSLSEIVEGVCVIHEQHGCHQNITPNSILCRSSPGSTYNREFKIGSLGSSQFKEALQDGASDAQFEYSGTLSWGAPETYDMAASDEFYEPIVGHSVDIWSLGCVFSEGLVWTLRGWEGLEEFRSIRRQATDAIPNFSGGDCFHNGKDVLPEVQQWLEERKEDSREEDLVGPILDDLILLALAGNPDLRPSARVLLAIAQTLVRHGEIVHGETQHLQPPSVAQGPSRQPTMTVPPSDAPSNSMSSERPSPQIPFLSVHEAKAWRARRKEDASLGKRALGLLGAKKRAPVDDLPHAALLNQLEGRHITFFVDDAGSMKRHWGEVGDLIELLVYMTKTIDPDGVELFFLSANERHGLYRSSSDVSNAVYKHTPQGQTHLHGCFADFLESYNDYPLDLRGRKYDRKQTLYILTDGSLDAEVRTRAYHALNDLADNFGEYSMPRDQICVQFIKFENLASGGARVAEVAINDFGLPPEIVDTESADGNVLKMLLGAVYKSSNYDNKVGRLVRDSITPGTKYMARTDIEKYLQTLFPFLDTNDFQVEMGKEDWHFMVPRRLTEVDRSNIYALANLDKG